MVSQTRRRAGRRGAALDQPRWSISPCIAITVSAASRLTLATSIDVYFRDPQSPWQRGSNENANGLLRQYFPEGTDLSVYSQANPNRVARQLNEGPRETLGFETPADRFNGCVASTG